MRFIIVFMLASLLVPQGAFSKASIPDIFEFPQDLNFYVDRTTATKAQISRLVQEKLNQRFNEAFFRPWRDGFSPRGPKVARQRIDKYEKKSGYGENQKKHGPKWADAFAVNADLKTYPNARIKGITIAPADIRELPTREPLFTSLGAAKIKNFDTVQYSFIAANTPVLITQISRDKAWVLVESHTGSGWIEAGRIAPADENFIALWQKAPHVAVTKDEAPITDETGKIQFLTSVGWLLPKCGEEDRDFIVLTAVAGENGKALIKRAKISKKQAVEKPMPLTSGNIARLGNQMVGKPYGWGGMDGKRDCSSTLKDLFTPFGIWISRDSGDQARSARFVSLKNLASGEKESKILKEGIPFLTLIWRKGHILLYLGEYRGVPVLFHNAWGATSMDANGRVLRRVVGKTVITSLYHGSKSREEADFPGSLINHVEGMVLLVERRKF